MMTTIGRILVVSSLALLFMAYSNFAPTALGSEEIADYVKNHFVREMIFGAVLAAWAIRAALQPVTPSTLTSLFVVGSVVVLPFWIASLFGWSIGGMEAVWGDKLAPNGAYYLHVPQVAMFYVGYVILRLSHPPAS